LIEEVQPRVVLTVGTSGGVFRAHDLGDVVVTRAAKFRLQSEFRNAPYNGQVFKSDWDIPVPYFSAARDLMQLFADNLAEPPLFAPTVRHKGRPFTAPKYTPDIKQDGKRGLPEFHPILTTDYFEFGTSTNHLELEGCAVEMGDAVLGLVAAEMANPPKWAVVRNLSDPQINGAVDQDLQVDYAVWYYTKYGYWTSVMSALATWAIIAGLP
jgi:nucleoside phosphorylase